MKNVVVLILTLMLIILGGCGTKKELKTLAATTNVVALSDISSKGYLLSTQNLTCSINIELDYTFGGPEVVFKGKANGLNGFVCVVDSISLNGVGVLSEGDIILTDGNFESSFLCQTDLPVEQLSEVKVVFYVKSLKDDRKLYEEQTLIVVI